MKELDNVMPRPSDLDEYVCDPVVKSRIQDYLAAAKKKCCMPPHMLFTGGPGTGKTTIVNIIAKVLNVPMVRFLGRELRNRSQLSSLYEFPEYGGILFVDECLPAGSLIVRADGGVASIEEVTGGQLYAGGRIKNTLSRKTTSLLRITTSHGEITTTPTHPHMQYVPRYKGRPAAMGEVREIRGRDLRVGDYLLSTVTIPHQVKTSWTPDQLAFVAMLIADACVTTGKYKDATYACSSFQLSWSKREQFLRAKKIVESALPTFKVQPTSYTATKNRDYVIRIYGTEFVKFLCETFSIPTTNKKYATEINNEIFYAPLASIKSFIDTILAFEGWSIEGHGRYVQMSSPKFIKQFQMLLKKFGVASGIYRFTPRGRTTETFRLNISDKRTNARTVTFAGIKLRPARITKIEVIPINTRVYDFTTTTHYFVADGFLTHNCHSVSKEVVEMLYPIMEDGITTTIGDPKLPIYLNPIMVIGATTEPGSLEKPLRDRFVVKIDIKPYTQSQLAQIVQGMSKKFKEVSFTPEAISEIAKRAKGVPRIAGGLLFQVSDTAIARGVTVVDKEFSRETLTRMDIDEEGLDYTDRRILQALKQHGVLGLNTLAAMVGIDEASLTESYEPYLMRKGYLMRTRSGRSLTELGKSLAIGK